MKNKCLKSSISNGKKPLPARFIKEVSLDEMAYYLGLVKVDSNFERQRCQKMTEWRDKTGKWKSVLYMKTSYNLAGEKWGVLCVAKFQETILKPTEQTFDTFGEMGWIRKSLKWTVNFS